VFYQKTGMKKLMILAAFSPFFASAQLKTSISCNIYIDILAGKVNDVEPDFTPGQIKKSLPCFTGEEAEGAGSACGGLISYTNNGIYFYTGRDYVEVRENFKGKLSIPLMRASRGSLFRYLGHPRIRDAKWDAFQTQYGTLILYYNAASKVNKIQFSSLSTEAINLCE
jgi:hypothetical protein